MVERRKAPAAHRLRCCQGATPPVPIVEGWKKFLDLPEAAAGEIWTVLEPGLLQRTDPATQAMLDSFCRAHGVKPEDLAGAVLGCGFLVERASALNLGVEDLKQDLATLSDGDPSRAESILSRYDELKTTIRQIMVEESLADHGKVLTGLDWRIDTVSASDRGADLQTSVIFLTLRYRDGDRHGRITFQLTPQALSQLRGFMGRFQE